MLKFSQILAILFFIGAGMLFTGSFVFSCVASSSRTMTEKDEAHVALAVYFGTALLLTSLPLYCLAEIAICAREIRDKVVWGKDPPLPVNYGPPGEVESGYPEAPGSESPVA